MAKSSRPALPTASVLLAVFRKGVNTGAAYGAFAQAREERGDTVQAVRYAPGAFSSWDSIAALAVNDFEPVVSEMHRGVAAMLPTFRTLAADMRRKGAPAIGMMSGSGATCFLLHTSAMGMPTDGPATMLPTFTR